MWSLYFRISGLIATKDEFAKSRGSQEVGFHGFWLMGIFFTYMIRKGYLQ